MSSGTPDTIFSLEQQSANLLLLVEGHAHVTLSFKAVKSSLLILDTDLDLEEVFHAIGLLLSE